MNDEFERIQSLSAHFLMKSPMWVKAPGRINLIGEHTDYNHGFVFPAAIDKAIYLGFSDHDVENHISVYAVDLDETVEFEAGDFDENQAGWAKYIMALTKIWMEREGTLRGFRMAFGGNIPIGAGLSSSAAIGTGMIHGIIQREAKAASFPLINIARMAQAAEHMIGANVGIMDQYAVLFGKKNAAILLDCRSLTHDYFPIDLPNHQLVLINTKVSHNLADSAYNDRRASCEKVLAFLKEQNPQIETLRDIDLDGLQAFRNDVNPVDFMRVENVLEENQRVHEAAKALANNDLQTFGNLLYQSHQGLSKKYEVSCEELDLLVDLGKQENTILGARMMGGGFGGCTINLMEKEGADPAIERIVQAYESHTEIKPEVYKVKIEEGVKTITMA